MKIPNFLIGNLVDDEGKLTVESLNFLTELVQVMQNNLSDNGVVIPSQLEKTITEDLTGKMPNGTLIYDSTNNVLKVNINGTFKEITVI